MQLSVRKFSGLAIAIAGLLVGSSSSALAVSGVDLNTWVELTTDGNGFWDVDNNGVEGMGPNGFFVRQEINGAPTIFASTDDFINTTVNGKFEVEGSSDDDFIGFVFGLNAPTVGSPTTADFLLFDWKQGNQSGTSEGFRLSYVSGDVINSAQVSNPYWTHTSTSDVTFQPLGTDFGGTRGWVDPTVYDFTLTYTTETINIKIKGGTGDFATEQTIFDIHVDDVPAIFPSGEFPTGKFGFYNFSQDPVRYEGFTLTEPQLATTPDDGGALNLLARVGSSDAADVDVTNTGGGGTNLTGTADAPVGAEFGGTGGAFALVSGESDTFTYTYTPDGRTLGIAETETINIASSDPNDLDGHDIILSGQGVGPVAAFDVDDVPTPVESILDHGCILLDETSPLTLTLANITTDDDGGDSTLTDLSVLDLQITGADAGKFELLTAPGAIIAKGGELDLNLLFDPDGMVGQFSALLTITTDQNAAFGQAGDVFQFQLTGKSEVPEPASVALLAAGFFATLRRRR